MAPSPMSKYQRILRKIVFTSMFILLLGEIKWKDKRFSRRSCGNGETVKYLGMDENISLNSMYIMSFSLTINQYKVISEYNNTCSTIERDSYFHILNEVKLRDNLRYQDISINRV